MCKYQEEINDAILRQIAKNPPGEEKHVLDVGCGMGALSEEIRKKGYAVWGVELDGAAAAVAEARITKVLRADAADLGAIGRGVGSQRFDYLVFADILEHLPDPVAVLRDYRIFLKPGGCVLVSLPNTVVWLNRIQFLFGKFEYTDTGVMDRDHLRFFTFKTARRLVEDAGYLVVRTDYIPFFVRAAEPLIKKFFMRGLNEPDADKRQLLSSPYYAWYIKYLYPLEYVAGYLCQGLCAYKMVIVGTCTTDQRVTAMKCAKAIG